VERRAQYARRRPLAGLLLHLRNRVLGDGEYGIEIDGEVLRHCASGMVSMPASCSADAVVDDQDVEASEALNGGGDEAWAVSVPVRSQRRRGSGLHRS